MSVATEQTTKHFIDLWVKETVFWRKRIVVEAPASWDASQLANLNSQELDGLTEICERDWDIEKSTDWESVKQIDVSGPVPDDAKPDIVFKLNLIGDLVEAESGEPAVFNG